MRKQNLDLYTDSNLVDSYLTPSQAKRLAKRKSKLSLQEPNTHAKTERHHENRIASLKPLVPMTDNQKLLLDSLRDNVQTLVYGSAGVGKTFCTVTWAAQEFLKGNYDKIILTRPNIGVGGKIPPAVPGTAHQKLENQLAESIHILKTVLSSGAYEICLKNEQVEIVSFDYIRGRSFDRSIVIVNEAQNTTVDEVISFLTRIGQNSKVVLDGDIRQSDIKGVNGLQWTINMIDKNIGLQEYSGVIRFTADDIVRSGLCKEWVKAIEREYPEKNN